MGQTALLGGRTKRSQKPPPAPPQPPAHRDDAVSVQTDHVSHTQVRPFLPQEAAGVGVGWRQVRRGGGSQPRLHRPPLREVLAPAALGPPGRPGGPDPPLPGRSPASPAPHPFRRQPPPRLPGPPRLGGQELPEKLGLRNHREGTTGLEQDVQEPKLPGARPAAPPCHAPPALATTGRPHRPAVLHRAAGPHLFPTRIWQGLLLMSLSLLCRPWAGKGRVRGTAPTPPHHPPAPGRPVSAHVQRSHPHRRPLAGAGSGFCPPRSARGSARPGPRLPPHAPRAPNHTHDVVYQVAGGPDDKEAHEWGKKSEPGQRGDLREALPWRGVMPARPPGATQTVSPCPRTQHRQPLHPGPGSTC